MKLSLPKSAMESLPQPGEDGLIRATVAIRIRGEGEAELVELNDSPLPSSAEEEDTETPIPDAEEMEEYAGGMAEQLQQL